MKKIDFNLEKMLLDFSFHKGKGENGRSEYYNGNEILEIINSDAQSDNYECLATTCEEAEIEFFTVMGDSRAGNDEKLRRVIKKWLELTKDRFQTKKVYAYAFDFLTRQMVLRKMASFY